MTSSRQLPCPTCGRLAEFSPANRWRPFCCERCKMIDLGQWANENYRIPDSSPAEADDTDETRLQ